MNLSRRQQQMRDSATRDLSHCCCFSPLISFLLRRPSAAVMVVVGDLENRKPSRFGFMVPKTNIHGLLFLRYNMRNCWNWLNCWVEFRCQNSGCVYTGCSTAYGQWFIVLLLEGGVLCGDRCLPQIACSAKARYFQERGSTPHIMPSISNWGSVRRPLSWEWVNSFL